jgi:hypothetical protein
MGNFKYKIAEASEILKPTEVDPALIKRIEKTYGPVDMKNDFFSANLKTYFKTSSVNTETGSVGHKIIKLSSFADSLEKLYTATNALSDLVKSPGGKDDAIVVKLYDNLKTLFNSYRTHLRKYYPDQYAAIKDKLDEISSVGGGAGNASFTSGTEGENYATKYAFGKYKYKLSPKKQLKEAEFNVDQYISDLNVPNPELVNWIRERLKAFDTLEQQLNTLVPLIQQAKQDTIKTYSQNPNFSVIYGTDMAQDYLNDLIDLFKKQ